MNILTSLDGLLVTNATNIRYLTGFVGAAPEEREVFALLTKSKAYLFVTPLYEEAARKLSPAKRDLASRDNILIKVISISREHPIAKELAILTKKLSIKKLGFEEADLTVSEYKKLKQTLKGATLVPTKNRIEKLRMIKRPDEIALIKSACKLTDQCFDFILGKLRPGVTEAEIAWEIESFFRSRGAGVAFSPIVAFGKNTSQPHYDPKSPKRSDLLRLKGPTSSGKDLVLLDFGARVNGYCADMTRVVFVGKPTDEWKRAYDTVLKAQQRAIAYFNRLLGGGRSGAQADRLAREVIKTNGFPLYPHSLGHGVGLNIHESSRLTVKKDVQLKPGMIFTVEPAVYKEGQYGIRVEDLILLTKEGIDILTKSSKEFIQL